MCNKTNIVAIKQQCTLMSLDVMHIIGALTTRSQLQPLPCSIGLFNYLQAFYLQQSIWVDNMVERNNLLEFIFFALFSFIVSVPAMSYEEPKFTIIKKTDVYQVRRYERLVTTMVTIDSSFRVKFDYISGANKDIQ